jgi:hypothetical protein
LEELAKDSNSDVRLSVAQNPNCPIPILEELAKDSNSDVRLSVAQNPNCPIPILEELAKDSNSVVREVCITRLMFDRLTKIASLGKFGRLIKLGQASMDLGDPSTAGRDIAIIIKFLLRKIPFEQRPMRMMSLKQKILALRENEMSLKKSPSTAAMGQSITLVKILLNGKDPNYIRRTLEHIVENLHI